MKRKTAVGGVDSVTTYWRRIMTVVTVFAVVPCASAREGAQNSAPGLPTQPILRIETGQHGGTIHRVDTDAANRFVVTASDDKTVRVWSLLDGQLLRVLRLPIDQEDIGKAYAVAISPDGDTVAVGGFTGPEGHNNIFLFDRASGELKQRLGDLPDVINHLAYSPDGRRLAASLGGRTGIRVFDVGNGYLPMPSDTQYGGDSYWVVFESLGRLAATSYDGFVRLYAVDRYDSPIAWFETAGHLPYSAAFSPDGTRIAIAYADISDVPVLSGIDLKELYKVNSASVPQRDLGAVGWSEDGHFLFASDYWQYHGVFQVRRWRRSGRGAFVDIHSGPSSIQQILGLREGRLLFASVDNFGVIGPDTKPVWIHGFGAVDLSSRLGSFRISENGDTVQADSWRPGRTYRFTVSQRQLDVDPPSDASLLRPATQSPGLSVTNWNSSELPAVNRSSLPLYPYETSRSLAFVPGTENFVLGTDWWLRLFDSDGHEVWPAKPVGGPAWHVNVTSDGRLIVAAFGDGTIRWSRVSDGEEVLALFIQPDDNGWIAWTPQGFYDASLGADDLIGWHINHGYDRAPDFYPVSLFRDRFYRPDVIRRVLQTPDLDVDEALKEANQAAGRPTAKTASLSSLLTPAVEIVDPKDPAPKDRADLQLTYSVRLPSPEDSLRVEALVDGVKVAAVEDRLVDKGDIRVGVLRLTVPRHNSTVSVIAYNDNGASVPASVHVQWLGEGNEPKLTLYVLAVGVSNYKEQNVRLRFAAKDADDFVALAKAQAGGLYEKVIPYPEHESLRDQNATRNAILDGLDWITHAVANTNDVAMVFLSGHGMSTPDQHYRFLPYDYDWRHVERTTISDAELRDYLTKIGGKKIFFFDTCYSGAVLGGKSTDTRPNVDKFANELKAAENGIVVFASSTGSQLSLEREEWNNGAFSKAIVEGMRGAAARPGLVAISTSDLQGYVSRRVKELTHGSQRPVMAIPKTVDDYWIAQRLN